MSKQPDTEFEVSIANRKLWTAIQPALKKAKGGPAVFCQIHDGGTKVRIRGGLIDAETTREIHKLLAKRLEDQSSLNSETTR